MLIPLIPFGRCDLTRSGRSIGIMPVMGVTKFERFFRLAASIDVDKDDLKRYQEFVDQKLYDLLLMGQAAAKANNRDVLEPWDLPITKGLQESIHEFRRIDADVELAPILEHLAARPPLDVALSEETAGTTRPNRGGRQRGVGPGIHDPRPRCEESQD
jgi:hypothetical protein